MTQSAVLGINADLSFAKVVLTPRDAAWYPTTTMLSRVASEDGVLAAKGQPNSETELTIPESASVLFQHIFLSADEQKHFNLQNIKRSLAGDKPKRGHKKPRLTFFTVAFGILPLRHFLLNFPTGLFGIIDQSANFGIPAVPGAPSPTSRPHLDTTKPKSIVTVTDLLSSQSQSGKWVMGGSMGGPP